MYIYDKYKLNFVVFRNELIHLIAQQESISWPATASSFDEPKSPVQYYNRKLELFVCFCAWAQI